MDFKKWFKPTMAFMAAYGFAGLTVLAADNEVTIGNGQTKQWDDVVGVLNGTTHVTGDTTALPRTNAAKLAQGRAQFALAQAEAALNAINAEGSDYNKAISEKNTALETAKTERSTANTDLETEQGKLKSLQTAVTTAKGNVTTAQNDLNTYIGTFETAYNNSVALVDAKKNQINSLTNNDLSDLDDKLTAAKDAVTANTTAITTATTNLSDYRSQLANITHREYEYTTSEWYQQILTAASQFKSSFDSDGKQFPEAKVYYAIDGSKGKTLYLAFTEPAEQQWAVEGTKWVPAGESEFYAALKDVNIVGLYVYVSNSQTYLSAGGDELLNPSSSAYNRDNVIQLAVTALNNIKNNKSVCDRTLVTSYTDDEKANELLDKIEKTEAEKTRLEGLTAGLVAAQTTAQTNYDNCKKQISDLQKEVDTLNDTTNPALKAKWDAAKNGTLTGDAKYTELKDAVTAAEGKVTEAENAVTTQEGVVSAKETAFNEANDAVTSAQADYDAAVKAKADAIAAANALINTRKDALATANQNAQDAADALAVEDYKTITLTGDLTITTTDQIISKSFSGTIWGGNHFINNESTTAVFSQGFSGQLHNAAVNGSFASATAGATFSNVAYWPGTGNGAYYDETGARTQYTDLAALGFAARNLCGIDYAKKDLVSLGEDGATKVYSISVYSANSTTPAQYYVQKSGKTFVNARNVSTTVFGNTPNEFAKSETEMDLPTDIANVFYAQSNSNVSNLVEVTDGSDWFCPVEIHAEKVVVNRTFNQGANSICLPFPVSKDMNENITSACYYDRETPDKFWFTKATSEIPANRPVLLIAKEKFSNLTLTGVTVGQTDASQTSEFTGVERDNSTSFGTYKRIAAGEFLGEFDAPRIYGLRNGIFQAALATGDNAAVFPAFRMVLVSETAADTNAPEMAKRKIGILDEFGNDVTGDLEGVEDLTFEAYASFDVVGGQGVITFTADADYGKIPVYTLDGKVAATANVVAGTTTVNVQTGVYIVNGKKILVK